MSPSYREVAALRDGTEVVLRMIRPQDRVALVDGLQRMSPASRYRRFFSHRDRLSSRELTYLTEIDHETHVAIVAGISPETVPPRGLGVARFIRDPQRPQRAEAAVAVVDDVQGQGLGGMLFARLIDAAIERGVTEFELSLLASNDAMLGLLKQQFPGAKPRTEDNVIHVVCPLPVEREPRTPLAREDRLYTLLRLAAQGVTTLLKRLRSWPLPEGLEDVAAPDEGAPRDPHEGQE